MDALTADQVTAGVNALADDLAYVLQESGVPRDLQGRLGHATVVNLKTFSRMAGTEEGFREWLTNGLRINPADVPMQVATANFVCAWEASRLRVSRKLELEAEERASKVPRTVLTADHVRLRVRYAAEVNDGRTMLERDLPSPITIEQALEQLEDGELKAEDLASVSSLAEETDDSFDAHFGRDGKVKFKKAKQSVAPPATPEQLRYRLRLLAAKWHMLKLRLPDHAILADYSERAFSRHVEYILGPDVAGLEAQDAAGHAVGRPNWQTVLSYELQVRRMACRYVNEAGITLAAALEQAARDSGLKERYLTTPMAVSIAMNAVAQAKGASRSKSPAPALEQNWQREVAIPPPPPAPKGETWKPVTRNQFDSARKWRTPGGKNICRKYNTNKGCEGGCDRLHICDYCVDPAATHKVMECPHRPAAATTQDGKRGGAKGKGKGKKGSW